MTRPDDVPRDADPLHRLHRFWERRFAARGGEGERGWLAHGADELPERHADEKNDEPKNQDDENDQPQVERENEIPEINQHSETLRPDGMRHRCADADRREHHDVVGEFEHHLRKALHRAHDRLSFFADGGNGHRE